MEAHRPLPSIHSLLYHHPQAIFLEGAKQDSTQCQGHELVAVCSHSHNQDHVGHCADIRDVAEAASNAVHLIRRRLFSRVPQVPSRILGKLLLLLRLCQSLLFHGKCLLATGRPGVTGWQPLLNLLQASVSFRWVGSCWHLASLRALQNRRPFCSFVVVLCSLEF